MMNVTMTMNFVIPAQASELNKPRKAGQNPTAC